MLPENPYKFPLDELVSDGGLIPVTRDFFVILKVFDYEAFVKVMSSAIEGAETIYPLEYNEVVEIVLDGAFMDCTQLAQCLLNNQAFIDALKQSFLNDGAFTSAIGDDITQQQLIEGNNNNSQNRLTKDLAQTTNDRDVVYGGCREVVEYMLDLVKTLAFFMQGISNIVDLVGQLYAKDKRKRYEFEARDQLDNGITIGDDGEIVTNGGDWQFVPNILGQLVQSIAESTMLGFLTEFANIGASLILADITDTRQEALTCIMFNIITCDGANAKPPPYVFDNGSFFASGKAMAGNFDAGVAGQAVAVMLIAGGVIGEFVSAFPLTEVHRNYRIGMRSPSSEWVEACESCDEPDTWEYEFNFVPSSRADWWTNQTQVFAPNNIIEQTTYVASEGWGNGRTYDGARQREDARIISSFNATITGVTVEYRGIAGAGGNFSANSVVIRATDSGGTPIVSPVIMSIAPSMTTAGTFGQNVNFAPRPVNGMSVVITGYQRAGNNNPNGATYIRKIIIRGVGVNPFV